MSWWREAPGVTRVAVVTAVLSLLVALGCVVALIWMEADPQYWFPDAFAEQGAPGVQGPPGEQGPQGKPGPVGPTAQGAITDLQSQVEDLQSQTTRLQSDFDDLTFSFGPYDQAASASDVDDLAQSVDDLRSSLQDFCLDIGSSDPRIYTTCGF